MRILVMAAGAVGGYFGGLLVRADNDVVFVARGDNLAVIRDRGLNIESVTSGDFTVEARAVEHLDGSWTAEMVLFCVKSYHNEVAIETIRPAVGDETVVLTLQNGLGSEDELSAGLGTGVVMPGAAYVEAAHPAPGVFQELGGVCRIVFSERADAHSERGGSLQSVFSAAGIDSEIAEDIDLALWGKLVYICGLSGMTCITRSPFAEVMDTPETAELTMTVVGEAAAVGRAAGVALPTDIVETTMEMFRKDKDHLISSMHADLTAGRPLEVGNLNGKVSELGREYGVRTPANDLIAACLAPAHRRALSGLVV